MLQKGESAKEFLDRFCHRPGEQPRIGDYIRSQFPEAEGTVSANDQRIYAIEAYCTHDCKPEEKRIAALLRWLGAQAIAHSDFRVNEYDICAKFIIKRKDNPARYDDLQKTRPTKADFETSETNATRQFMKRAKRHLDACHGNFENGKPGQLFIDIPHYKDIIRSSSGNFTLRFSKDRPETLESREKRHKANAAERRQEKRRINGSSSASVASELWKRLLAPVKGSGLLIYSNEQPEIEEAEFKCSQCGALEQTNFRERLRSLLDGKYSGSGEVSAGFLIGTCLGQTIPFDTRRSGPLARNEDKLLKQWGCLIFLGSPISNGALNRLRRSASWTHHQHFHFDKANGKTVLYEAPIGSCDKPFVSDESKDYALISYLINDGQVLIGIAGTETSGTWGAARCLCDDEFAVPFSKYLRSYWNGTIPAFEAVLEVTVENGRPDAVSVVRFLPHPGETPQL